MWQPLLFSLKSLRWEPQNHHYAHSFVSTCKQWTSGLFIPLSQGRAKEGGSSAPCPWALHFCSTWLSKSAAVTPALFRNQARSIHLHAACFLSHFLVKNTIFICHWISEPINWRLLTVCVNQQLHSLQSPLLPAAKRWDLHTSVASGTGSTTRNWRSEGGKAEIKPLPGYR